jgi:hypothetical protein
MSHGDSMQVPHQLRNPKRFIPLLTTLVGPQAPVVLELMNRQSAPVRQEFYSISELAQRWRCSRGTIYNRLRASGAKVLDFAIPGKRGKKAVPASVVLEIENRRTKRLA